ASTNSEADIEKNGAAASPATARASSVLPVPGGPLSNTPRGMRPPRRPYFFGSRRKPATSESSCFASSMPATSAKVTLLSSLENRRARDRPNAPSMPPRERRKNQTRSSNRRIVGPKPNRRLSHHGAPVSSGTALTTTPFCSNKRERSFVLANDGISVENR